ncbi:MAG TPA: hypothetical protein VGM96_18230 [Reyranella sp.]|jgi:hypothetical protein
MQIPKQPRNKQAAAPGSQADPSTIEPTGRNAMPQQELNRAIHDAYKSYWDKISSGYLDAQRAQTSAYLNYLGSLQQAARASADAVIEAHRVAVSGTDVQAAAETQRKIMASSIDHQAAGDKSTVDAAAAYAQSVREIYEKLQDDAKQQGQAVADSLKDALLKTEVDPRDIPSLALLYQTLLALNAASRTWPA